MKFRISLSLVLLFFSIGSIAQEEPKKEKIQEIYGFVMMDAGYDFNQIDPNWFDVVRPTKLPA